MHKRNDGRQGFTIVELLIVVVVIAILATISVVAYTNIQERANDTAVRSDLKNIGAKFLEFQAVYGRLPYMTNSDISPMGIKVADGSYGNHYLSRYNLAYCYDQTLPTFALVAASKSGQIFVFREGAVTQATGVLAGVSSTCANYYGASSTHADWFYRDNSWNSAFSEA